MKKEETAIVVVADPSICDECQKKCKNAVGVIMHKSKVHRARVIKKSSSLKSSKNSHSNSSLTRSGNSKVTSTELHSRMAFLRSTLPKGALSIFSTRRAGRGFGVPTACPFCDEKPDANIPHHRTDLKRRWQVAHIAVAHVKRLS
jgi:hypothetical protein